MGVVNMGYTSRGCGLTETTILFKLLLLSKGAPPTTTFLKGGATVPLGGPSFEASSAKKAVRAEGF